METILKAHRFKGGILGALSLFHRTSLCVFSREFERALVRLRARVTKEDPVRERGGGQLSRQRSAGFGVIQV